MFFFHPAPHDHHADIPARHDRPGRSLLPALCLAAVMALGGMLTVPVAATSRPAPPDPTPTYSQSAKLPKGATAGLELTPANPRIKNTDEIWLGESRTYKAEAVVTLDGRELLRGEVTDLPGFKLTEGPQSRNCEQATCTPETAGDHTVEGKIPEWRGYYLLRGTTTLLVRQPVERLELTPLRATIQAGGHVRYTATGLSRDGERLRNVTSDTTFTATPREGPRIPCRGPVCDPTAAGNYRVTATLQEKGREPVTGRARLTVVPGEPETLQLDPVEPTVQVKVEEGFRAIGTDGFGNDQNLTQRAEVTISKGGSCVKVGEEARCKADTPGRYPITATLRDPHLSATATLIVQPEVIEPSINSVDPESGSPNTLVVVAGTTGSCGRAGTLTLEDTDIGKSVEGEFMTRFKVPSATPPGDYQLLLEVACDNGQTKHATHPFTVENRRPEPVDDPGETTLQDHEVSIPVTDNDRDPDDPDGYPTLLETEQPEHGATEVEKGDPPRFIRYTPNKGFSGPDRFQYRLCDVVGTAGEKQCGTATVTVTVSVPEPDPVDDPPIRTKRDQPVTFDVMENDRHPDAARLRVLRPEQPRARAEKLPDGKVRYTPEPGYVGKDTFRYDYCGSAVTAATATCPTATVTVTVEPPEPTESTKPPEPEPEPVDDPDRTTAHDEPVVVDVMGNDRNPDAARLRVREQPAKGEAEKQPGGAVRYTPDKGSTGTDTFTYDYCGDAPSVTRRTACPSATVTVTVEPPEPPPPLEPEPVDDPDQTTARDQPVVIDVMGNDRNPDAARLRVREQPAKGEAEKQPGGAVRYTPEPGFAGADTFSYDYCGSVDVDRQATCPSATVSVTVTSDPVITSIRPGFVSPGTSVKVAGSTGSCNRAGTLTLKEAGAEVDIAADQKGSFTASLTVPRGTAPRAYTLELSVDCRGQTQRAEGQLAVTNQAPAVTDDAATTTRGHAVEIPVTRNDRDPDDPDGYQTRVLASPPISGSVEVRDQTIVYTPSADFIGQDQFEYGLCDDILNAAEQADCGTATVTVSVTDVPAITSVSPAAAKPGTPVVVTGSTGSCDRSGTLTVEETGMVAQVAGEQNGNFATVLTVPVGTFPGDYRLALRVDCNGTTQQAEAVLSVTNEAPQAEDDEADTVSGSAISIPVVDNDRDPDDPDGYPTLLLVTKGPDHGTAEAQTERRTILYTPEPTHVGTDQFRYSLCDNTLNAAGQADCGHATVTVKVADGERCLAHDVSSIRVDPGKGRGGARLGITATVDRKLRDCPFRLLLGKTPLGPDVRAGGGGGITAQREVPGNVTPGTIPVRLATMRGDVLAQAPFEITRPWPWLSNPFVKALLGLAALFTGALARTAFRRWRPTGPTPPPVEGEVGAPDVRVEPHPRLIGVGTEPVDDGTWTVTMRLEPHHDPGTQWLQEADP